MRSPAVRQILALITLLFVPGELFAADGEAAMLYGNGTTWVNGSSIPKSSAVFAGDLIQTKSDSVANINSAGSSVTIMPDSLVEFQGNAVKLERGELTVSTSKAMGALAGVLNVTPASNDWTEFDVKNSDCDIQVLARKNDVVLQDDSGTSTLREGQQTTRRSRSNECQAARSGSGATPAAVGPITNSTAVYVGGGAAAGALSTWVLMQGDDPISPSDPSNKKKN
jgi:hypothetical protein